MSLILAVFVTVGLSLSASRAGELSATAGMAMAMDATAHGDCHGCPARGGDNAMAVVCDGMCPAPILAVAPQIPPAVEVRGRALFASPQSPLRGRTPPPEPYPPKPSRIV
jgi:hypothetical protein